MIPWACCYLAGQTHPRHLNFLSSPTKRKKKRKRMVKDQKKGCTDSPWHGQEERHDLGWSMGDTELTEFLIGCKTVSCMKECVWVGRGWKGHGQTPTHVGMGKYHTDSWWKKMDGHEMSTMCCGWPAYWYIGNPSHFSKKMYDLTMLHPVWKKTQQNPKGLPCLKTGYTLSVRPEATGAYRESKLGKQ